MARLGTVAATAPRPPPPRSTTSRSRASRGTSRASPAPSGCGRSLHPRCSTICGRVRCSRTTKPISVKPKQLHHHPYFAPKIRSYSFVVVCLLLWTGTRKSHNAHIFLRFLISTCKVVEDMEIAKSKKPSFASSDLV